MTTRTRSLLALVLVAALALAACGSSSKAPAAGGDGAPRTEDGGGEGGALTITDSQGEVTLPDGPATRVVAIEWNYVEDLLALGVTPVGVADIPNYEIYVRAEPAIPDGVEDVGSRQEPSIERIKLLQPDLIITAADRASSNIDELREIAPVLQFDEYPTDSSHLDAMVSSFEAVAEAVDREAEVAAVLDRLDTRIEEAAAAIEEADLESTEIVLSQGEGTIEAPMFRLFTDNAMVVELAARLGLENAIDAGDQEFGFISVSLEGLTQVGDAWFLPVAPDDAVAEFERRFGDSPTWKSLEFVRADRVRPLGEDTWFFGGPLSAELFVQRVVEALTT